MTEARRHDPKVDVPNGYQHRFAEVNGIRIHVRGGMGGAR